MLQSSNIYLHSNLHISIIDFDYWSNLLQFNFVSAEVYSLSGPSITEDYNIENNFTYTPH